jgi:hypothetical protein
MRNFLKVSVRTPGREPLMYERLGSITGISGMPRLDLSDALGQIHRLFGEGTAARWPRRR